MYDTHFPQYFADQFIKFRIPYSMPGELIVDPSENGNFFPEATFLHNLDKPFEIHRMMVRLTALDDATTPPTIFEPQPTTLQKRIRLRIQDTSKNEPLTKAANLVDTIQDDLTEAWNWQMPYTLVRSEGLQVQVDSLAFPTYCIPDVADCPNNAGIAAVVDQVRVEISFQGYLIVIQPASETR